MLNINPTDTNEPTTVNQLTCFNATTTNLNSLLGDNNCFNRIDNRLDNVSAGGIVNNSVNMGSNQNNYEVPFVQANQTTTIKTNQSIVRTNQPITHLDFKNHGALNGDSNRNGLSKISKLSKHLVKKNQLDKSRNGQQMPTSACNQILATNNQLAETQNLNNTIIEGKLFKANESVCRLFINNGQESNAESQINNQMINKNKYQISSQNKYQSNHHSQSVDNLVTKTSSISDRLLDFYNKNQPQAFTNQTYSTIGKSMDKTRYNSNLSLRTKYQRCLVNIPNLQMPIFKSALSNQLEEQLKEHLQEQIENQTVDDQTNSNQTPINELNERFDDNFNDSESYTSELIPSPAPPAPPERKVSLPAELRNDDRFMDSYQNQQSTDHFRFDQTSINDLKNQAKCLSFNHSTPTINNLNQFRYSFYLNKLKENEYQKQLEQNKLEQDQLSQSSTNESLVKSMNTISSNSSLKSFKPINTIDEMNKFENSIIHPQSIHQSIHQSNAFCSSNHSSPIHKMTNEIENEDEFTIRPSTSASTNTTRIMINYKKS